MDIAGIYDKVQSHAMRLGVFERFATHEPKNAPGQGLTWAMWLQSVAPAARASGVSATSLRLEFVIRLYQNMTHEPQDAIDPGMLIALDALGTAYSGDTTLEDEVMTVDLLGAYGAPFSARAGYLNQDGKLYRVFDVTLPIVVDDAWNQETTDG